MRSILLSAFRCNPNDVSEAFSAFQWIKQAEKFFNLEVITIASNEDVLEKTNLSNTHFKYVNARNYFEKSPTISKAIKFDYFFFNSKLEHMPNKMIGRFDLVHHHTPMGIRYPNALSKKSKKFLIGPIGGGVPTPPSFNKIFNREPLYYHLRKIDKLRFSIDYGLKDTYERSDKILIVGNYVKNFLPPKWHKKCQIMSETGIHADQFTPAEYRTKEDHIKLLFVGRIVPTKGLELLLSAMGDLVGKYNVQLDVIGGGDDLTFCKDLVQKLSIEKQVHFRGFMDKKSLLKYYQQCDIFVFPSLREASGNVIFEAMSCAKPLIVSNSGGPGQVVKEDFGIKINVVSYEQYVHDLIQALKMLIDAPDKRTEMGQKARTEVLDKYDWEAKGRKIKEIYDDLIYH